MKILCRKCPGCGKYSDVTVRTCPCGKDLSAVVPEPTASSVYNQERGQIDETLKVYTQKCMACGSLNCVTDLKTADTRCSYCGKRKLAVGSFRLYESDETDEEKKLQDIGGRLRGIITPEAPAQQAAPEPPPAPAPAPQAAKETPAPSAGTAGNAPSWSGVLNKVKNPPAVPADKPAAPAPADKPEEPKKPKNLTMNAMRYGPCSLTLTPDDAMIPVMLGRSAMKRDYLANDPRVGNSHCSISFRNGRWFVKDNNSANGTFLNDRDLGLGGEAELRDADRLKLGHSADSIVFVVSLE